MYNKAIANVQGLTDVENRPYYTQRLNAEQIAEVEQRAEKRGEKRGEERGEKRGIEQGIKRGELQHAIKTVNQLLPFGMPYEQIAQATGLDLDFVYELAAQARRVE